MDPKLFSLAIYALKHGDHSIKLVGKEVIDEWAEKGSMNAILARGMMYFKTWKDNSNMIHLRIALNELRKLPLHYIFENLPKFNLGEEAMQMLLPTPPERKRKSEEE